MSKSLTLRSLARVNSSAAAGSFTTGGKPGYSTDFVTSILRPGREARRTRPLQIQRLRERGPTLSSFESPLVSGVSIEEGTRVDEPCRGRVTTLHVIKGSGLVWATGLLLNLALFLTLCRIFPFFSVFR